MAKLDMLLNQIITDRRYISATDGDGKTVDLMVRSLTPEEKAYATFIYNRSCKQARDMGLMTRKQCMSDAINKGVWTRSKEKLISLHKAEIQQLEKQRSLYVKADNKGKMMKFHTDIIKARNKLNALEAEQNSYTTNSMETFADTVRANYTVSRMTLQPDGRMVWRTYQDFLADTDVPLLASIIDGLNAVLIINEAQIRKIARYPNWTIMWGASKNSGDELFGVPSTEYTSEQALLCYWSMMYDSVYESMDRPSDKIIEDDEALDKWFEDQRDKRDKEKRKSSVGKQDVFDGHKRGPAARQEQFVMANTELDANDIYDLNDQWTLAQIQRETKQIEESGDDGVVEYKLRRGQIKRKLELSDSSKFADVRKRAAQGGGFVR